LLLDSGRPDTLYNLGVTRVRAGNPLAAVEDFKRALVYWPDDPEVTYGVGWAYAHAGRCRDALEWLGEAISRRPELGALAAGDPAFEPCRG
ncbi:MAG TPA: tetratricopeptide repeat protein, partial [Chloroflexia bacterium]|nr:tetratricopeptide repeat protein [Chloroflexia bacterium]